jgi:hypothetical protein
MISHARLGLGRFLLFAVALSAGCVGGPSGTREEKLVHFRQLEEQAKTDVVAQYPKAKDELERCVGYAVVEKNIVKVPLVGWGSGSGVIVEKAGDKRTYVKVPEIQFGAGWGARAQKVVVIFSDVTKLHDLAGGEWRASMGAEAAAKAGDAGAAGGTGSGNQSPKGYTVYVMTEAGISATATVVLMRVRPYSLD